MIQSTQSSAEILADLAYNARVMTAPQIWTATGKSPFPWIRKQVRKGNVVARSVILPTPNVPKTPIVDWALGDAPPDFDRVAWQLSSRRNLPAENVRLVYATEKTKSLFGSLSTRPPRPKEFFHDACVTELFHQIRSQHPDWKWTHEDQLGLENKTRPDAILEADGQEVVIEVGGMYSAAKLRAIHAAYTSQTTRYQIW